MDTLKETNHETIPDEIEYKRFLENAEDTENENDTKDGGEETWGNTLEYLLALIGYSVGIAAIWRFPIICARNGGGAFLIPYITLMFLIGAPLYYVEISLGQFCGKGPWKSYEFCPLFKGVGFLMVTMSTLVVWYYQTIMAWIIYYLYSSFSANLDWTSCNNEWNTENCTVLERSVSPSSWNATSHNNSISYSIAINNSSQSNQTFGVTSSSSAASEFWYYNVLRNSSRLEDLGSIQIHLMVCLTVAWIFIYLCLVRGVKSIGKVVYITALFPYVLLTVLMVRGVTLDGAGDGILFYITPKFEKVLETQVWLDAGLQVFFSLGPMWGGIMTMAAFNKFHQPILRDSLIVCSVDLVTALYSGIVVFSVVGFMSKASGVPIEEMATSSGHGLAFVVYPTAASLLPTPQLWSALFFISMLLVILDSLFTMTEVTILSVVEILPRRLGKRRYLVNFVISILFLVTGLLFVTNGGIHLFQLIDWYVSSFALLIGAACESFMIGNIYGADRFSKDIEAMTGRQMSRITRILICIVVPSFSIVTFLVTLVRLQSPTYPDGSQYSPVFIWMAVVLGLVPLVVMIFVDVKELFKAHGPFLQRVRTKMSPSVQWVPKDARTASIYQVNPYRYEPTFRRRFLRNIWGTKETPYF